jgi:hypothetical protein
MFVRRDARNQVIGVYAAPQPGYATEALPDDHPEVKAFLERAVPASPTLAEVFSALDDAQAAKPGAATRLAELRAKFGALETESS